MNDLTNEELKIIRSLREKGFAVVIFTPEELQNVPPDKMEDGLVDCGWSAIDILKHEYEE